MRAVIQRVTHAQVTVNDECVGASEQGLVVLIGVGHSDTEEDVRYLVEKVLNLRIFPDAEDKMNLSIMDIGGSILAVSQFTLYGDCRKGRRPSFSEAASPEKAKQYYEHFVTLCREHGIATATGRFQAKMLVEIYNDGPVTLILDSKRHF